jgi:hypothetical protein
METCAGFATVPDFSSHAEASMGRVVTGNAFLMNIADFYFCVCRSAHLERFSMMPGS